MSDEDESSGVAGRSGGPLPVSLIAAMDRDRVIGGEGGIPWDLPRDREHFRAHTRGKAMLLGRVTYDEMRGWFTTQLPLVMSRRDDVPARHVVRSVDEAVATARRLGAGELVVAGGGSIYRAAMPRVTRMVLTFVDGRFGGTVFFPEWIAGDWRETRADEFPADAENPHAMRIVVLDRIGRPAGG